MILKKFPDLLPNSSVHIPQLGEGVVARRTNQYPEVPEPESVPKGPLGLTPVGLVGLTPVGALGLIPAGLGGLTPVGLPGFTPVVLERAPGSVPGFIPGVFDPTPVGSFGLTKAGLLAIDSDWGAVVEEARGSVCEASAKTAVLHIIKPTKINVAAAFSK